MTLASEATAAPLALPLELTPELEELRERARRFVDEELIPLEEEAERLGGRLPAETIAHLKQAGIEARLNGGLHSPEYGGQGWTPARVGAGRGAVRPLDQRHLLAHPERVQRLGPRLRGAARALPPSRPARRAEGRLRGDRGRRRLRPLRDQHRRRAHRRRLPDLRREVVRHHGRRRQGPDRDGERRRRRAPAADPVPGRVRRARRRVRRRSRRSPTTIPRAIRRSASRTSRSAPTRSSAGSARATSCSGMWFTEERIAIAARGVGAMWRLLDETVDWATSREQGDSRIYDYQGVSFPLADSAADAAAGRLLALTVAALADAGRRPQDRPPQGLDGEAVRQRGRVALRRPLRPGVRRPRLHALERRRAAAARAAGRPDLGGHERDPAPDRRARARAAGRRADPPLSGDRGAAMNLAPLLEPRSIAVVGANDRPGSLRGRDPAQPEAGRLRGTGLGRQPEARRGPRLPLRPLRRRPAGGGRRGRGRDPGGRGAGRRRGGRRARLRRRGGDLRRLRRGRVAGGGSRRSCARRLWRTTCPSAGRTETASSPCGRGRRCGATRSRRSSPEPVAMVTQSGNVGRERARIAARDPLAHASSRPATRPSATPATGSPRWPTPRASARSPCSWNPTATGAQLAEALARAPSATSASRCSRSARPGRARSRRRRTPARWRATSASSAPWSRRPAAPGRRIRTSCSSWRGCWPSRGRARPRRRGAGGPHLLGRRLGDRRRRGRAPRRRAAAARAGDAGPARGAPAARRDDREPARLHGDDLGRLGSARPHHRGGRRRPSDRPAAALLRPPARPLARSPRRRGRRSATGSSTAPPTPAPERWSARRCRT